MKHLKLKDIKLRKNFKKLELQLLLKKFIFKNLISYFHFLKNKDFYKLICFQVLKKKRKKLSTKFTNRCVLTNRSKSIRHLKISRIKAREFISFGILPGYKKAVW